MHDNTKKMYREVSVMTMDYERINRTIDFIQANLGSPLSLSKLSSVACFSKFHFHRIFRTVTGESVHQYVKRLRLEKAALLLLNQPDRSITDIAMACGFATPSAFSKSFKSWFSMTASQWRVKDAGGARDLYVLPNQRRLTFTKSGPIWIYGKNQVRIEEISLLTIAYIRNVGPFQGDDILFDRLYTRLFKWALPRDLVGPTTYTLNIYHDRPGLTDNSRLRVMTGICVPELTRPSGPVGITTLSGGRYGVCRFCLKKDEFSNAWQWLESVWLPDSGYRWDERPAFERCHGEKTIDSDRWYDVDICIPVVPS